MASPPRRPSKRKIDAPREAVSDRAIVAKPADPRQAGLFDMPLPKWIRPCLPTLVDKPPVGPQWVHEIKWDGYRVSAYVADGKAAVRTRNGHDWTARFPAIAAAAERLPVRSAVIDGEAVILDDKGRSSFAALSGRPDAPRLPACRALRLRPAVPGRRSALEEDARGTAGSAGRHDAVQISDPVQRSRSSAPARICSRSPVENDLEGIVSKRLDRPYHSGRSRDWLKTKCVLTDSFVIIGYQPGTGAVRTPIANIKIARFDGHRLRYAGAVGTAFSEAGRGGAAASASTASRAPACAVRGLKVGGAVWVSPDLASAHRLPRRRNDGR